MTGIQRRILLSENLPRALVLLVLIGIFGALTDGVTYSALGLSNILLQSSIIGIAATGQAFVILAGGIDVSLYGIGVLASVVGASTLTSRYDLNLVGGDPWPLWAGISSMLSVGVVMGAVNGLLVARLRIPALIATFGMWQIGLGLAQLVGGGYTINNLPPELAAFGQGRIAGIPLPVIEMIVLFAIAHWVLRYTSFGRSVYAVGGNSTSAYLSGIKVQRVLFLVFVISGLTIALAALSIEARMMSVSIRTLSGIQLDSIAAVAIGGISIYGGRGTILGVLLGTLILTVIDSGLGALGASTDIQNTLKGAIIILAVSIEFFRSRGMQDQMAI